MQPVLFVDLDGVLVDLKQGVGQILKMDLQKLSRKEFEPILNNYLKNLNTKQLVNYWATLPETKNCKKLWDKVKDLQPLILSACGHNEISCQGKKLWCKKHLGIDGDRVFCSKDAEEKQNYASPKSILIDDFKKSIDEFTKRGGHGIHHTSLSKTLSRLRKVLHKMKINQK